MQRVSVKMCSLEKAFRFLRRTPTQIQIAIGSLDCGANGSEGAGNENQNQLAVRARVCMSFIISYPRCGAITKICVTAW